LSKKVRVRAPILTQNFPRYFLRGNKDRAKTAPFSAAFERCFLKVLFVTLADRGASFVANRVKPGPALIFRARCAPNRIREYRRLLGLTQEELAAACGVTRSVIARLDANPNARPSLETALRLARAFNVDVRELISEPPR
jgi:putative transcriptional regulator